MLCPKCKKDKPSVDFLPKEKRKGGRQSYCLSCGADHNSHRPMKKINTRVLSCASFIQKLFPDYQGNNLHCWKTMREFLISQERV